MNRKEKFLFFSFSLDLLYHHRVLVVHVFIIKMCFYIQLVGQWIGGGGGGQHGHFPPLPSFSSSPLPSHIAIPVYPQCNVSPNCVVVAVCFWSIGGNQCVQCSQESLIRAHRHTECEFSHMSKKWREGIKREREYKNWPKLWQQRRRHWTPSVTFIVPTWPVILTFSCCCRCRCRYYRTLLALIIFCIRWWWQWRRQRLTTFKGSTRERETTFSAVLVMTAAGTHNGTASLHYTAVRNQSQLFAEAFGTAVVRPPLLPVHFHF